MSGGRDSSAWTEALPSILKDVLGPVKGELASDVWTRRYAKKGGAAVIAFMRDVADECQLSSGERRDLRTAIHQARSMLASQGAEVTAEVEAGRIVALHLLRHIRQRVMEQVPEVRRKFTLTLGAELKPSRGLHDMAAPALGWMVQGGKMPDLSLEALTVLVHATYVTCCKVLGPVETDVFLGDAVTKASAIPEARLCPPSRLLYP